jgi:hypothetical protein
MYCKTSAQPITVESMASPDIVKRNSAILMSLGLLRCEVVTTAPKSCHQKQFFFLNTHRMKFGLLAFLL